MTTILVQLIFTTIDFVILLYIFSNIEDIHFSIRRFFLLVIPISFANILIAISSLSETSSSYLSLISSIIFSLLFGLSLHVSFKSNIVITIIYIFLSMVSEWVVMIIFQDLFHIAYSAIQSRYFILGTVITYVFKIIFSYVMNKIIDRRNYNYKKFPFYMIVQVASLPLISITLLGVLMTNEIQETNKFTQLEVIISIILAILALNFLSLLFHENISQSFKELEVYKMEREFFRLKKEYIKELNSNIKEVSIMRHDLKNSFIVLNGYLENKQYEDLSNYLESQIASINETNKSIYYTPNYLLNYFLNQKIMYAESLDISVQTKILLPEEFQLEDNLLAALIGNLFDNAIEACERLDRNKEKSLSFRLKYLDSKLFIELKNTFDHNEIISEKKYHGQGIGQKSIQKIIQEYNGIISTTTDEEEYCTTIIFYVK